MAEKSISSYPVPHVDSLPVDIRDKILAVQEKAGFVPNIFLTLAHRPEEFRAFFAYHDALMLRDGNLSKAEREMIVVATSGVNQCLYCVVAHGAILRIYQKDPLISDQIAIDHKKADITDKQKMMLDFAVKLARNPETITPYDHKLLQNNGFGKDEIWDIGAITAFFALSNRMAHLIEMRANDEFYLMGRLPNSKK
ncbi:peroxidase-related enzyme [Burkholderiales bacterium]|nr:peroxidase-related enzyme [Burkholderiales bacterium]